MLITIRNRLIVAKFKLISKWKSILPISIEMDHKIKHFARERDYPFREILQIKHIANDPNHSQRLGNLGTKHKKCVIRKF